MTARIREHTHYGAAASQFLRAMRGSRSQLAFSRRLGHRSNTASDWEAGRRFPTAADTLAGCARIGIDVLQALQTFHRSTANLYDPDDGAWLATWMRAHKGGNSALQLAGRSNLSRHQIHRWTRGLARPRLPEFLEFVQVTTGRASDLVAALVPIEEIPALSAEHETRLRIRRLAFELPWAPALLTLLETQAAGRRKRHDIPWISRCLGADPRVVRASVKGLLDSGVLVKNGMRLEFDRPLTIDPRSTRRDMRGMQQHWAEVGRQRLANPRDQDLFSFNLFALSKTDMGRIHELQRAYFRNVRSIVAASEPSETVGLMLLHLVDLGPSPATVDS